MTGDRRPDDNGLCADWLTLAHAPGSTKAVSHDRSPVYAVPSSRAKKNDDHVDAMAERVMTVVKAYAGPGGGDINHDHE